MLDFSHNSIMGIDDNTLVGINTTFLDLSYNSFRKMPNLALRKLKAVTTLVLDGNLFHSLKNGCIHNINVKFLSISDCKFLARLDQSSIANLPYVESITLTNNPILAYFHPGAVSNVPNLVALLLTNNNLSSLEDIQPYVPSLRYSAFILLLFERFFVLTFHRFVIICSFSQENIPGRQHVPVSLQLEMGAKSHHE